MTETVHVSTHRLRFNDTDKLGHVNNAVFAVMLEQGRSELLSDCGLPLGTPEGAVVIVRLELDFVAEMTWPGDVRIETSLVRLGNRSFTLGQTLHCNGRACAKAVTVLAVMDQATRKAIPIDPWRDALARWQSPAA